MTETISACDGISSSTHCLEATSPKPSTNYSDTSVDPVASNHEQQQYQDVSMESGNDNDGGYSRDQTTSLEEQNNSSSKTNVSPQSNDCSFFKFGPYVPILRKGDKIIIDPKGIVDYYHQSNPSTLNTRLTCEVLPDDAIVEAPSLVTPLLLKKKTLWPPKTSDKDHSAIPDKNNVIKQDNQETDNSQGSYSSDGVEIIKVVPSESANSNHDVSRQSIDSNNVCRQSNNVKELSDEFIKTATIASLTHTKSSSNSKLISTNANYFNSSVGELLQGIGLSRVTEFCLHDTARRLANRKKRFEKKGEHVGHILCELKTLQTKFSRAEASNRVFKSEQVLTCSRCPFKSEFSLVMNGHMEIPHRVKRDYLCSWCEYRTNESSKILFHNFIEHKKRCRTEKPPSNHQCRYCPYECRNKVKLQNHITRCEGIFPHDTFMGPQDYGADDYPTLTSKFITQQDVKSYEHILKTLRLAAYNPHHINVSGFVQPIRVVPRQYGPSSSRASNDLASISIPSGNSTGTALHCVRNNLITNSHQTADQRNSVLLMNLLSTQNNYPNQPRASVVQYPKTPSSLVNVRSVIQRATDFVIPPTNPPSSNGFTNGMSNVASWEKGLSRTNVRQPQQLVAGMDTTESTTSSPSPNPKGSTFVICEICDGYIKDLNQLKSHMQWIHKVKIHQKMLLSRPPLNCQKCQWRFFTDQGLERHLLGAHGLVTSNMQEQVDRGTDSGRCTVCGRAYANKLVAHMREVHKSTLKPAHLSYKCTVCAATFNLYRLFENHVYSVHSESVKRVSSK